MKTNKETLAAEHNFLQDTIFKTKTILLTGKRSVLNLLSPTKKFKDTGLLKQQGVIARSSSELWNPHDNASNWILTAGKIQNLRIAAQKLNGIEVKANEVFSFWRHIGYPNFGQGYVLGREIREGCVLPTIAGGLCQLSNALYDAALKANFDIVERHKHSKVIKGSLAEQDRDATVKWNYVDLRFKSSFDFRIEVELTADKLILFFRSAERHVKTLDNTIVHRATSTLNDCYSCGNLSCFKHPTKKSAKQALATSTFILDEKWPEFDAYVEKVIQDKDQLIVPFRKNRILQTNRYEWTALQKAKVKTLSFQGMYRALKLRLSSRKQNNVFEQLLALDAQLAKAAAGKIPIHTSHLVISQNLLPFIYETGVLGGRTFDVLMTRLPLEQLHQRLDFAQSIHQDSPTLSDFRASKALIELENRALAQARKIITPHAEIANLFQHKVERLQWVLPKLPQKETRGKKVLFPASALARKGAYELKALMKSVDMELVVSGGRLESANFWEGEQPQQFDGNYEDIALVVYPTYIEQQPRQLLKAVAMGIPVVTTSACGIEERELVSTFELLDFDGMEEALKSILQSS